MTPAFSSVSNHLMSPEDTSYPTALIKMANTFINKIDSKEISTRYSHDNTFHHDKEILFNCYGFISFLIKQNSPEAFEDLLKQMLALEQEYKIPKSLDPLSFPSPYNYYTIFKYLQAKKLSSSYWEGLDDVFLLKPGDVLVYMAPGYQSPTHWDSRPSSRPTGTHVMVVEEVLEKQDKKCVLKIIDSTRAPHNKIDDTRHKAQLIEGGIGKSSLVLKKLEGSHMYSLKWSKRASKRLKKEVMVGRLKDPTSN